MAYKYQDISELRARLLGEIEQYYKCHNDVNIANVEFQEQQYSDLLDNLLGLVETETT